MILEPHVVFKPFTRVSKSLGGTPSSGLGEGHTFLPTQEMKRNFWGHSIRAALNLHIALLVIVMVSIIEFIGCLWPAKQGTRD